jgi:hypothetical protein
VHWGRSSCDMTQTPHYQQQEGSMLLYGTSLLRDLPHPLPFLFPTSWIASQKHHEPSPILLSSLHTSSVPGYPSLADSLDHHHHHQAAAYPGQARFPSSFISIPGRNPSSSPRGVINPWLACGSVQGEGVTKQEGPEDRELG